MQNEFDPEVDEPQDPMQVLGDGMRPLPDGTDMDMLIAAYGLIGRMGAGDFEVGYDDEKPGHQWWYARCSYPNGETFTVDGRTSAHIAAQALARKMANGGRCTHCGKVVSLWSGPKFVPGNYSGRLMSVCYWGRDGKVWVRGCIDTHAEGERTKDAINDFIDRTGSRAIREV